MKKTVIPAILLALIGAAWMFLGPSAFNHASGSPKEEERVVATAETRDINFNITVSGDVAPATQFGVKSEFDGKVITNHAEPGQTVKTGDPLVDIDERNLLTGKVSVTTEIDGAQLLAASGLYVTFRYPSLFQ